MWIIFLTNLVISAVLGYFLHKWSYTRGFRQGVDATTLKPVRIDELLDDIEYQVLFKGHNIWGKVVHVLRDPSGVITVLEVKDGSPDFKLEQGTRFIMKRGHRELSYADR